MKRLFFTLFILILLVSGSIFAQNNALVFYGDGVSAKGHIVLYGGIKGTPIYLVVNQDKNDGISRKGTNAGWIISEGEFNYVQWNIKTTGSGEDSIPFGANKDEYIPLMFKITSAGTETAPGTGNVLFSTYGTPLSDNKPFPTRNRVDQLAANALCTNGVENSAYVVDRWWIIDAQNYTAKPACSLTFTYRASEAPSPITEANLQAQRYDNIGTDCSGWESYISGGQSGSPRKVSNVIVPSTDLFRLWVLVSNDKPLPVELLHFDARCNGNKVDVEWATASETNNDFFTVQRSPDGVNWEDIVTLAGAGNSNNVINYFATDNNPYHSTSYYRLMQTDYDGSTSYSDPVSAENCYQKYQNPDVFVFLDPAKESLTVLINGYEGPFNVQLYDILGRLISSKNVNMMNTAEMNVGALSYGVYFVVVRAGDNFTTRKIYISR